MENDFDITVSRTDSGTILQLMGDIDSFSAKQLQDAIRDLLASGEKRILVSMSKVDYIDSYGLGTLVGGLRRAREHHGDLSITDASEQVVRVLSVTGLHRIFDFSISDEEGAAGDTP